MLFCLKFYYFNNGYFNVVINYNIDIIGYKKVKINYNIMIGIVYILDLIRNIISILVLDFLYKKNFEVFVLKLGN